MLAAPTSNSLAALFKELDTHRDRVPLEQLTERLQALEFGWDVRRWVSDGLTDYVALHPWHALEVTDDACFRNVSASSINSVGRAASIVRKIAAAVTLLVDIGRGTSLEITSSSVLLPHCFSGEVMLRRGLMTKAPRA